MIDWSNLSTYIKECDNYASDVNENPASIPALDESITKGLSGLRDVYGLDLDNPETVYALVVGFCVAYRFGCTTAMGNVSDPFAAQVYLRQHGPISGNIGLVARSLVKNLGVTVPEQSE